MPQNQHYISKCLTKPWESNGMLNYFDFETQKIESEPSRRLFSKMDLWPQKLENIFRNRFEKQLTKEILDFIKNTSPKQESISFRHILLMHLFNAMRGMRAHHGVAIVEQFALLSNGKLDEVISEYLSTNIIIRIPINPQYRLFFSEDGFFSIPLTMINSSEMNIGFAIPISTSMAFGIFPDGYNRDELLDIVKENDNYLLVPQSYLGRPK